jgi:hypothetical protein
MQMQQITHSFKQGTLKVSPLICEDLKRISKSCKKFVDRSLCSATRNARCHMTPYHAGAPMERVHLDFMGPLPKTKKGNEYVLMKRPIYKVDGMLTASIKLLFCLST